MSVLEVILNAQSAFAAGSADGHASLDGQTIKTIGYQAFNVTILLSALLYVGLPKIRGFLKQKRQDFLAVAERAQAARVTAEKEFQQVRQRLDQLEAQKAENILRAKAEAADLKNQIEAEAQTLAKRIREEARASARSEVDRARRQLQEEMFVEAGRLARQSLEQKVSSEDHERLQGDFIQNIQVVQG